MNVSDGSKSGRNASKRADNGGAATTRNEEQAAAAIG